MRGAGERQAAGINSANEEVCGLMLLSELC